MGYKLGSLFDGSGGFPLAGSLCGIEPCWASEVEPYPIAVTRERFPQMKHLGDISKINGAEIKPVDIITFGSPCQDLSVAGKRAGLKHEANGDDETTRSGLFMEAVRIIKEMRKATNGRYPTFVLWENVPGAYSSNGGDDFRIVLEELIKIVEPTATVPPPEKNGWPYADAYTGDGWSIAYRTLDAQYWGVPQRRRRIYLVADFRGERAAKVLFEREGLRGYFEKGGTPWKGTASDAQGCPGAHDREGTCVTFANVAATLRAGAGAPKHEADFVGRLVVQPVAYAVENRPADSRVNLDDSGKVQTLTSRMGTGGGNVPMVMEEAVAFAGDNVTSPTNKSTPQPGDPCHTLSTDSRNYIVYCLQGNGIDRADTAGCNGKGVKEDVCYTLNTIDRPAVAYGLDRASFNQGQNAKFDFTVMEEKLPTLTARGPGAIVQPYIVRRLTPTECARLQGFADWWAHIEPKDNLTDEEYGFWLEVRNTHAAINGKQTKDYTKAQILKWYNGLHTDSSEYKMWGNGIALPTALYVMQGITEQLNSTNRRATQ